jgi:hypothetical protein
MQFRQKVPFHLFLSYCNFKIKEQQRWLALGFRQPEGRFNKTAEYLQSINIQKESLDSDPSPLLVSLDKLNFRGSSRDI